MLPLTEQVPKPLLTVANEPLLAGALRHARALASQVAVTCNHLGGQIAAACGLDIHVVRYNGELRGAAGVVGDLAPWIGDLDVLIVNGDTWFERTFTELVAGYTGAAPRLLVVDVRAPSDFGSRRFVGAALLPNRYLAGLRGHAGSLTDAVWRREPELEFVEFGAASFDCGTPAEFLAANLHASGGAPVVHPTATVLGQVTESVILAHAAVSRAEVVYRQVRDGAGHVVQL